MKVLQGGVGDFPPSLRPLHERSVDLTFIGCAAHAGLCQTAAAQERWTCGAVSARAAGSLSPSTACQHDCVSPSGHVMTLNMPPHQCIVGACSLKSHRRRARKGRMSSSSSTVNGCLVSC